MYGKDEHHEMEAEAAIEGIRRWIESLEPETRKVLARRFCTEPMSMVDWRWEREEYLAGRDLARAEMRRESDFPRLAISYLPPRRRLLNGLLKFLLSKGEP